MRPIRIDAHRALNAAVRFTTASHSGRDRYPSYSYRPGVIARYEGYAVTMASDHAAYAVSRQRVSRRPHLVRAVYMAWKRGSLAGLLVICWCGTRLVVPQLLHEIPDGDAACRSCEFRTEPVITLSPARFRVTVEASAR